jgi:hypothetical protein
MEYATITAHKRDQLWWQGKGLSQTATGYGSRLATEHMVKVEGAGPRWRRVYAICYSNVASFYVHMGGQRVFIQDSDLDYSIPCWTKSALPLDT